MQQVRGVVAKAKGTAVSVETINVPDPGPGEAVVHQPPGTAAGAPGGCGPAVPCSRRQAAARPPVVHSAPE